MDLSKIFHYLNIYFLGNVRKIKTGRDYDPFNDDEAD